jgi:4-aminobutyrate aminotransferase/(S)-3-amino-2-methylpropionate transaminase
LQEKYSVIGDVRGLGLYLGVEFVLDRSTKQPAPQFANFVKEELKKNFILTGNSRSVAINFNVVTGNCLFCWMMKELMDLFKMSSESNLHCVSTKRTLTVSFKL